MWPFKRKSKSDKPSNPPVQCCIVINAYDIDLSRFCNYWIYSGIIQKSENPNLVGYMVTARSPMAVANLGQELKIQIGGNSRWRIIT